MGRPEYAETYRTFRWARVLGELGWDAAEAVNLGTTLVDRHAASHKVALYWFGKNGAAETYTFRELSRLSNRFANLLRALGVTPGDRVAGVLPRVPETLAAMIATWKVGAIYVPIFTGFGPEAIQFRVSHSGARVVCAHFEYRSRLPEPLQGAEAVITVAGPRGRGVERGDLSFWHAVGKQSDTFVPEGRRRDEPAVLVYTSGSTGQPKAVAVTTNFLVSTYPYMKYAVDLKPEDVFWPTADPGWGYGLVCYSSALAMGMAVTAHEAVATPELCLSLIRDHQVTNFVTTPTVLRGIMALGADVVRRYPVALRCVSSGGEPLNPEVVAFFREHWRLTPADHYGASEFSLPIANLNGVEMEVRPGSMGLPVPGGEVAIIDDDGRPLGPGQVGQIALRLGGEGYYALGYWQGPGLTLPIGRGDWLCVGDLARRDADGYFWFEGRVDDIIKSAGYRIAPFEVESAILRHGAVAEAAVVGKPDALRGQIIKAFVVLRAGRNAGPELRAEIMEQVKNHLGGPQCPREIEFVDHLPKTETGKIQRYQLRRG